MQPAREPLKLGLFMPNCSNMYAISSWRVIEDEWTWPSNLAIAGAAGTCPRRVAIADLAGTLAYVVGVIVAAGALR